MLAAQTPQIPGTVPLLLRGNPQCQTFCSEAIPVSAPFQTGTETKLSRLYFMTVFYFQLGKAQQV